MNLPGRQLLIAHKSNSLLNLSADLNAYKTNLLSTGKSEHLLLAQMIQVWAAESDKAVEAFKLPKNDQELTDLNREPWPEDYVIPILGKFRSNTLKITVEFIGFLQPRSAIRNRAEQLYDWGLSQLVRYFRVNFQELKDLSHSIILGATRNGKHAFSLTVAQIRTARPD